MACVCSPSITVYGEVVHLGQVLTYETPQREEFSMVTSYRYEIGQPKYMSAVVLAGSKNLKLVNTCPDAVRLYRGDDLLTEVYANPDESLSAIKNVTIGILNENDGLIDFGTGRTSWLFVLSPEVTETYKEAGRYRLVIPEGLFTLDGETVGGGEIPYNFLGDIEVHYPYTVTPASGSEFDVASPMKSLTITLEGDIRMVDYPGTPGALYDPDGKALRFESSYAKLNGASLTWIFKENWRYPIDWQPGEYTFRLRRNTINVNCWCDEGIAPDWPEEDITVLYVLKDDLTAVSITGAEAAQSYTVYTLDGLAVAVDAPGEALTTLPEGVYIINGKKAHIH